MTEKPIDNCLSQKVLLQRHLAGGSSRARGNNALPPAAFFVFPFIWLGFTGIWVATILIAVIYSIKAGRGEWAEYPVVGGLARRVLKIGPGGALMDP
jgi:hypothetical protein